jgi:hypothetical protein
MMGENYRYLGNVTPEEASAWSLANALYREEHDDD